MEIRAERPEDVEAIRSVTLQAFAEAPEGGHIEAAIIDALRAADGLALSLVAVEEGRLAGHIAFSAVRIDGSTEGWYGLGPLSVTPDRQRRGIGQALVREGLRLLRQRHAQGCVLLGDPAYYRRFGFASDPVLRFGDVPTGYFQRLVFRGTPPEGEVRYHPAFEVA